MTRRPAPLDYRPPRDDRPNPPAPGARSYTAEVIFAVALLLLIGAGIYGSVTADVRTPGRTADCVSRLMTLNAGLQRYAEDHDGDLPDSLGELVEQRYTDTAPQQFICKLGRELPPPTGSDRAFATAVDMPAYCSYAYLGRRGTHRDGPRVPLLVRRCDHRDGTVALVYSTGDFDYVTTAQANAMLQDTRWAVSSPASPPAGTAE